MSKRVIAFAASSSRRSINKQLVTWACGLLEDAEVEILDLRQNHFGDVGLDALVNSPHLKNLRALDLRNNQITRVGLESLARADTLAHLETLDLRLNKVGKRWEDKLRASEKLPALATVRVV